MPIKIDCSLFGCHKARSKMFYPTVTILFMVYQYIQIITLRFYTLVSFMMPTPLKLWAYFLRNKVI